MNKALLEYEMKRNLVTVDELCNSIGMSKASYYRKCKGVSEFTLKEINAIVDFLKLESPMEIFFADKVS